MKQRVQLFAVARQLAQQDVVEVDLPETATVADLRRALVEAVPQLAASAGQLKFAIGTDYAEETTAIPPHADLACIPPVSGG